MRKVYFPCDIMMRKVPYMSHGYLHTVRALLQQNKLRQNTVKMLSFSTFSTVTTALQYFPALCIDDIPIIHIDFVLISMMRSH